MDLNSVVCCVTDFARGTLLAQVGASFVVMTPVGTSKTSHLFMYSFIFQAVDDCRDDFFQTSC